MKFSPSLFGCLALVATTIGASAAAPAAKPAPAPATNAPAATPPPAPAPAAAPAPAPAAPTLKLDDYIAELTTALKLTDPEKKEIEGYYVSDGAAMKTILNDDSLSPMQQEQKISEIRDSRNGKINELLYQFDRQQKFLVIEAKYRVALTMLAADSGLTASAAPAK